MFDADSPDDAPRPQRRDPARPERKPGPRPERREPAPAPSGGGSGSLFVGLAAGFFLAFVAAVAIEMGTEASPLRHAGMKGKDERQLARDYEELETKFAAEREKVEAETVKVGAAERVRQADQERWLGEKSALIADLEKAAARHSALEKLRAEVEMVVKKEQTESAAQRQANSDLVRRLRKDCDAALGEAAALRAAIAKLKEPPRVVIGVPAEVRARETGRRLFAVPPGARSLGAVFGMPTGMTARADGGKVAVTGPAGFDAVLALEQGYVTITGSKLDTRPLLGFAVIQVRLAPGEGDAYYHLVGGSLRPDEASMTSALNDGRYWFTYDAFGAVTGDVRAEYNVWKRDGPLRLGPTARVKVRGVEYVLVRRENEPALENWPREAGVPRVTLALDKEQRLYVEVTGLAADRVPRCQIVTAELVRAVPPPDEPGGARPAVLQELLRIR